MWSLTQINNRDMDTTFSRGNESLWKEQLVSVNFKTQQNLHKAILMIFLSKVSQFMVLKILPSQIKCRR